MTNYTSVFGGTTINPSDVSYERLSFMVDTDLAWPREAPAAAGTVLTARIIDCTAQNPGLSLFMPDASQASNGETTVFNNVGANNFLVKDVAGSVLLSVDPGTVWLLYLTDNTASNGSWRSWQAGAAVSQAQAALLAGAGLEVLGGTLGRAAVVNTTAVTPSTVSAASQATLLRWTGGAGVLNFDACANLGAGWLIELRNDGTGAWVLTPHAGDMINGVATLTLSPGDSCEVHCDGAGLYTVGLGRSVTTAFDIDVINVAGGAGDFTLAGSDLNRIGYRFTGALTGNRNIIVPNTIQQYWVDNATTGAFTLTVKTAAGTGITVTQGARKILESDGVNVLDAESLGLSFPIAVAQGGTGSTTAGGARTNLGSTAVGDAVFTAVTAAAARAALGSTTVGDAVFIAATAAAALTALTAAGLTLANNFTASQTMTLAVAGINLKLQTTDAGAVGATLQGYQNSASPAAPDEVFRITATGRNTTPADIDYGRISFSIQNSTAGSTRGGIDLLVLGAESPTTLRSRVTVADGIQVRGGNGVAPTGADPGVGFINVAGGYEVNGSLIALSDVVVTGTSASPGFNDHGKTYIPTGAGFTLNLPQLAGLFNGYKVGLQNQCASGVCQAAPFAGDTFVSQGTAGLTTVVLPAVGDQVWFIADVTNSRWLLQGRRSFETTLVALTTGAASVQAHSLGVRPKNYQLVARCVVNDNAYLVGDEIPMPGQCYAGTNAIQKALEADATNLRVIQGTGGDGANFRLLDRTTPAGQVLTTTASWNLLGRAWVVN